MKKVSIIIPVYNKAPELEACLDSILSQRFREFECILVNDGSTDLSGEICDRYAQADDRIRVVHKPNGGVSSARNVGIERASGDFLMFCDADDTILADTLENLLRPYSSFCGQLVVGEVVDVLIDPQKNTVRSIKSLHRTYAEVDASDPEALYDFFTQNNMLSACGKLYCRDLIMEHGIRFDTSLVVLEDYAFVLDYLACCQRICMIPEVVYRYITLSTSSAAQRRSRKDFLFDVLAVSERLDKHMEGYAPPVREKFQEKTIFSTLRYSYDILWSVEAPDPKSRKEKYAKISKAIKTVPFQKMLRFYKDSFGTLEYQCLKAKSIWCLLLLHGMQRAIPHKRKK